MLKLLIIDDHALFRQGLQYVLVKLDEQVVILEASDFEQAMQQIADNHDLDFVLLDLNMPGKDGCSTLKAIAKNHPTLPVVMLSASSNPGDIQRSLAAGAMGYISKTSSNVEMLNALRQILSGETYVPPVEETHY